ncbi:hypothetical protein ACFO5K_16740 [Nocardia halotolerans]|uniref:Uncharacterized protein n=1 Tax=Nocardia halotolerans TaxID=1755878 RepID=A0ABV8VI76_9NOCA
MPATAAETRAWEERQRKLRAAADGPDYSSSTSRKVGLVAIAGIAALVGGCYLVTSNPDREPVVASCVRTDADGTRTVVADSQCDSVGSGGGSGRSRFGSDAQYHYYYGGNATIGRPPSGGSTLRPRDVEIRTKSGKVIQRGGLGSRSGGSGS